MRLNPARAVSKWWHGKDVRIDPEEPDTMGGMAVIHETEVRFHWSRKWLATCIAWVKKTWAWGLGLVTAITVAVTHLDKLAVLFEKFKSPL